MKFVPLLMMGMKHYWFVLKRILVRHTNQEYFALIPILETVAESPILYYLFCKDNARQAHRHTSPKRYTSPSTYRENSSYPAERKVSFS